MYNFLKRLKKPKIIKYENIAKHFNTDENILQKALFKLKYIEKSDLWIIATEKGKQNGAIERYNNATKKKYVIWNEKILQSNELMEKIQEIAKKPKRMTQKEKNKKGRKYEIHIKKHFESLGWNVGDHSGAKGKDDRGIDLIASKDNFIYFIQCKNWETKDLTHKDIKATITDVNDYLKKDNLMLKELIEQKRKDIKILYIVSNDVLNAGAKRYIKENSNIVEYKVIPMIDGES